MQEMLDFIEKQMLLGMFIGLNTSEEDGEKIYTVDYWEVETTTNSIDAEVEVKAGKQKVFII